MEYIVLLTPKLYQFQLLLSWQTFDLRFAPLRSRPVGMFLGVNDFYDMLRSRVAPTISFLMLFEATIQVISNARV